MPGSPTASLLNRLRHLQLHVNEAGDLSFVTPPNIEEEGKKEAYSECGRSPGAPPRHLRRLDVPHTARYVA